MILFFQIRQIKINKDDPRSGILVAMMFATIQATPAQLVKIPFLIQNSKRIGDSFANEHKLNQISIQ
jgi:hypothetical protein